MSMTDPVSDMLTRIRNASNQGHEFVHMPASRVKASIAEVLKTEGFIRDYRVVTQEERKVLDIHLKYDEHKEPAIEDIKRLSKPGLRRYVSVQDIPRVMSGLGVIILSTPQGMLSDREAKKRRVGGELICSVT